ncbi:MAG: hypothetical protein KAJ18_08655 [Candidatus Omnitrophica bacterium]|nr:hypothetical protein [Candidatus Omnitrophota bacterium]
MAGGSLGRLNIELSADTVKFNRAMDKSAMKASRTFNNIVSSAKRMAGMLAVVIGPAALGVAIKRIVDDADELSKLSRKIGVSVQSLSVWRHAAQLAGTDFEVLIKGVRRFSRVMSDASHDLLTAKRPLDELNVSYTNADGTLRNIEDTLLDVADRFSKMENGTKKAALAAELFGKAGVELIPFLNEGRDGIEQIRIEAEKLGIIFDERTARGAELLNDNLTRLSAKLKGVGISIGNEIIPVLLTYSDKMVTAAKDTDDLDQSVGTLAETILAVGTAAQLTGTFFKSLSIAIGDISAILAIKDIRLTGGEFLGPLEKAKRYYDEIKNIVVKSANDQKDLWNLSFEEVLRDRINSLRDIREETNKALSTEIEERAAILADENKIMAEGARIREAMRTPLEKLTDTHETLNELIMAGAINQETYNRAADKAIQTYDKQTEQVKKLNPVMKDLGATFSSQFEDAIVEGKKFSEVLKGLESDIIRIIVRRKILEPIIGAIFGSPTGGAGLFSAKGNVFSGGSLSMFAQGGVINSPIAFPMAGSKTGIAGEAGVEAILPLMRTAGGDLGVNADVGSRTVVNVITPPGAKASEERQMEGGVERINVFIDGATANNIRPGTKTYRALKDSFGLNSTLINR